MKHPGSRRWKPLKGMKQIVNDRLVSRWRPLGGLEVLSQGKRVSAGCPITEAECRVYVGSGPISAVRFIMDRRGVSLAEAKQLLDYARYGGW